MFIAIRSGSGLACSFAAPQVLPKLCVATGASNLGQPDDRLGSLDLAEEGRRPSKLSLRQCASRWARASATPQSRLRSSFKPTSSVARWSGRGIRSTDQHTSLPQQPDYLTARIGVNIPRQRSRCEEIRPGAAGFWRRGRACESPIATLVTRSPATDVSMTRPNFARAMR